MGCGPREGPGTRGWLRLGASVGGVWRTRGWGRCARLVPAAVEAETATPPGLGDAAVGRETLLASEGTVSRQMPPAASGFWWPRWALLACKEGRRRSRSALTSPWFTFEEQSTHLGAPVAARTTLVPLNEGKEFALVVVSLLLSFPSQVFQPLPPHPTPSGPWPELGSPRCSPQPPLHQWLALPRLGAAHCAIRPNICPSNHWRIHQCQWAAHCSDSPSRTTRAMRSAHRDRTALPGHANRFGPVWWGRLDP